MKTRYYGICFFVALALVFVISVPGSLAKPQSKDIQSLVDGDEFLHLSCEVVEYS